MHQLPYFKKPKSKSTPDVNDCKQKLSSII